MLPDISNAFILFGGGLAFLLALVQLVQARSRFKNILLFIIFSSLAVIQVQGYAVSSTHFERTGIGMMIFLMSKFILSPSIYIFYLSVFRKDYVFSSKEFIHFIPSLFVFIIIIFVLLPTEYRDGMLSLPYLFIEKNSLMEHLHSLGYALILGYLLAIFSRLEVMKVLRDTNRERLVVVAITVITILFLITAMIIISMITGSSFFARGAMGLTTLFLIYWFVISQIHPEVFLSSPVKNRNMHRIEGLLQGIDVKKLQENLDELLMKEKLYCDEDLSLKRLADLLSIQQQELSVYLNHYLQMNFNSYLNKYRVDEAIILMKEDKERSLLSIAFAVGFNSKSVFYDAFTKQTGLSPARYRKTFLSSN
jgi:AraC-like DNA-binding protein